MDDSSPDTYNQLMAELYDIAQNSHGRYRSDLVYRGVDVQSWNLQTSLQRLGEHYVSVEGPLLRNFIKYSVDRELSALPLLYKLAFAQHHGLPTRVLDWTTAPKVALHFAVGDERHFDQDGVVWAVDVTKLRNNLPEALSRILSNHRAFVFSVDMLTTLKELSDLEELGVDKEFPIFFEPPSLDGRIVNQAAILSIMPSAQMQLQEFLMHHRDAFRRITIRKELKWEVRDKLDQDGVTERILFPGEDGTARWLRRYYGPGSVADSPEAFPGPMTGSGT